MAKPVSINVAGIAQATNFLIAKSIKTEKEIKIGLTKAAVFLQGEVKQSIAGHRPETISVDTGRFLNSVGFQVDKLTATVFSDLPYAQKLEFGTDFKNSPRKHFRNSKDRSKEQINKIMQNQVDEI